MTDVAVSGNMLRIGEKQIAFAHPILTAVPLFSLVIVVLSIPAGYDETENVYAVEAQGTLRWQIQSTEAAGIARISVPYVGVSAADGLIRAVDFYGARILAYPQTGRVVVRERNGRDW